MPGQVRGEKTNFCTNILTTWNKPSIEAKNVKNVSCFLCATYPRKVHTRRLDWRRATTILSQLQTPDLMADLKQFQMALQSSQRCDALESATQVAFENSFFFILAYIFFWKTKSILNLQHLEPSYNFCYKKFYSRLLQSMIKYIILYLSFKDLKND